MEARIWGILLTMAVLSGCASTPQQPIAFQVDSLHDGSKRIGVLVPKLPVVDTHLVGAGCLLCYAAASAANSALTKHTQTLSHEGLPELRDDAAEILRGKGSELVLILDEIDIDKLPDNRSAAENAASKDFSSLGKEYNVDKILVLRINTLGMWRTYSAYFPTSDPKGAFRATGYLVDLASGTYAWYHPVEVLKSAEGEWDEPPSFPGLTNAYYQALEVGRETLLKPLQE